MKKKGCIIVLLLIFGISQLFAAACGDVNNDEMVDIVDALLIAQDYVDLNPANYDSSVADVNNDGIVDIVDALLVAQYYVDLINELDCGETEPPTSPPTSPPTQTPEEVEEQTYELQAEAGTWSSGGVESDHAGYTGSGYVNVDNASGEWIEWSIEIASNTNAKGVFTYACASEARSMKLIVNGTDIVTLTLPASGAWDSWATDEALFSLNTGLNKIRLEATNSNGGPNMDKMDLTIGSSIVTPTHTPSPVPTDAPTTTPVGWTPPPTQAPGAKPRMIATTDGETDDRSTMVRFLMYTCDFDVIGIVQVNSRYQKSGHSRDRWVERELDLYEDVRPNLLLHNPDYPTADYLRGIVRVGNENSSDLYVAPPNMSTKNTAGEQYIISKLLDDDPRPIHIPSWGGANTTASALWRLKTEYSQADYEKAVSKIRIYCIWYQDGGGQWIEDNIPGAYIFEAFGWDNTWDYGSTGSTNPPEQRAYMTSAWLKENQTTNHGALGAYTPQDYVSEGDTPSFLNLIDNGLLAHEDYTLGGWGGRGLHTISSKPNYLTDGSIREDGISKKHYWRWIIDCQNDFEARMDWNVQPFSGANHPPVVDVLGDYEIVPGGLGKNVSPGETVNLTATATDPDGDSMSYNWWQYYQKDSVSAELSITNANTLNASFTVPNERGKQIEIIFEAKDNGSPNLKRYKRVIFNIN